MPGSATVSPRGRRTAISVGSIAVLLTATDAYVVTSLFVQMSADMDVPVNTIGQATPIITGFLLAYIGAMPLLGGLSDKIGRRTVVQLSLAGFLVGSIVSAYSLNLAEMLSTTPLPIFITGRAIQGLAGGALLPVTLALVADLWDDQRRPAVLGVVGAAQELGSVLGPLYGWWLANKIFATAPHWLASWRSIFWLNVPLTLLAMIAVGVALPGREAQDPKTRGRKVDLVGGVLLAAALGLLVLGLNNGDPTVMLPPHGPQYLAAGAAVLVLFLLWEWRARTRLVDLTGTPKLPFVAIMLTSLVAGSALLVTLFDITLFGQGILGKTPEESALLLVRFLIALPIGAVVGGLFARSIGLRPVIAAGFVIATAGYWLVNTWKATVLTDRHEVLGLSLPQFDSDLAIAGFGLGLVIAPLSAAVLRIVPASQHGVASAAVVVARSLGMLFGFSALTSWGLHRFTNLTADLTPPPYPFDDPNNQTRLDAYNAQMAIYTDKLHNALLTEYHEIFLVTSGLCLVAAVLTLAIRTRDVEAAPAVTPSPATA